MAGNRVLVLMGATTDQYLYLDLYLIGDAGFVNARREKKIK